MADEPLARLRARYLEVLLAGDARGAIMLIDNAARAGTPAEDLYLRVLQPAMQEVGERWEHGEIGVADEHFATAATSSALAGLAGSLHRGDAEPGSALVCGTPGERHRLGGRMVADFLEAAGWTVAHVPETADAEQVIARARDERVDVVALSTSLSWLLPEARRLCVGLHALPDPPRVIVGGRAYRGDPRMAELVGADAFAADPESLLAELSVVA